MSSYRSRIALVGHPSWVTMNTAVGNVVHGRTQVGFGTDIDFDDESAAKQQMLGLIENGVTHVIDVRTERCEDEEFSDVWESMTDYPAPKYLSIPMDDDGHRTPTTVWEQLTIVANRILGAVYTNERNKACVYVHCHMGVNRGPSVAMALMHALYSESDESLTLDYLVSKLYEWLDRSMASAAYYFPDYLEWFYGSSPVPEEWNVMKDLIETRSRASVSTIRAMRALD